MGRKESTQTNKLSFGWAYWFEYSLYAHVNLQRLDINQTIFQWIQKSSASTVRSVQWCFLSIFSSKLCSQYDYVFHVPVVNGNLYNADGKLICY